MLRLQYDILRYYFNDASKAETLSVIKKYCLKYHIVYKPIKTQKDIPELVRLLPIEGIKTILPKILYSIWTKKNMRK